MNNELADEFLDLLNAEVQSRSSALTFEMAYQVRIAIDRIKFAIGQTERLVYQNGQLREANLQLLDALDRLQSAELRFQRCWRKQEISSVKKAVGHPDHQSETSPKNAVKPQSGLGEVKLPEGLGQL